MADTNTKCDLKIDQLNDDCLVHIFSYLSVTNRLRIERVSKRWQRTSRMSWKTLKKLDLDRCFWGVEDVENTRAVDYDIFKKILQYCGPSLVSIDLSNDNNNYDIEWRFAISVQPNEKVFSTILKLCPNIKSINVGNPNSASVVQFIAHTFTKLTSFSIECCQYTSFDKALSNLFMENKKLKILKIENGDFGNYAANCFLDLDRETLEELHLISNTSKFNSNLLKSTFDQNITFHLLFLMQILKEFKKLHTLSISTSIFDSSSLEANQILNATNAETITVLKISDYNSRKSSSINDNYACISNFVNLEELSLSGKFSGCEILEHIGKNCKKLRKIDIYGFEHTTDASFACITSLPQLQIFKIFSVKEITDNVLSNMANLKYLKCYRCPNIKNDGLATLIKTELKLNN